MRGILSIVAMLTIAPVVAVTTLVCWSPERWGGSLNPLAILGMAVFGLLTVPLWPTYVPTIVLTPILMKRIAARPAFFRMPVALLLAIALLVGALAGICVLGYVVLLAIKDSFELAANWVAAGAVSGALTSCLICLIYRYAPRNGYQSDGANAALGAPRSSS